MPKGVYIHIPFCNHICHYCDFNKVFLKGQPVEEYLSALDKEMALTFAASPASKVETIFIGGGTPTALSEKQLESLLTIIRKHIQTEADYEFTVEANPNDLSKEKLSIMRTNGVNRLSIGVQTFSPPLLKIIGRTHTNNDVYQSIALAKEIGFNNISIDLMYGLPNQSMKDVRHSLSEFFSLNIEHCSAYSLIVEPKTVFYNLMRQGRLLLPKEDVEADMYEEIMAEMTANGFHQYEISNYAKQGYESRHNLLYWDNKEYYGFGAGAHSYIENKRRSNIGPVNQYMKSLQGDKLPIRQELVLTEQEKMEEEMFLGLRKTSGVDINKFQQKFNISPLEKYKEEILQLEKKHLIQIINNQIQLTKQGRLLGNEVFQAFLN
ncbi:radical SAM family heme chaperone HemW [Bacillus kwashiorkori]|uniref:radical SAM family heme chaperone HemW n=1 Tax=Bacillus kwashiorkori TaxID=1522318 RepID=UPI00078374FF|nr:radical SAM family heme chaperone HemW [Bacillus kwashiorkori]